MTTTKRPLVVVDDDDEEISLLDDDDDGAPPKKRQRLQVSPMQQYVCALIRKASLWHVQFVPLLKLLRQLFSTSGFLSRAEMFAIMVPKDYVVDSLAIASEDVLWRELTTPDEQQCCFNFEQRHGKYRLVIDVNEKNEYLRLINASMSHAESKTTQELTSKQLTERVAEQGNHLVQQKMGKYLPCLQLDVLASMEKLPIAERLMSNDLLLYMYANDMMHALNNYEQFEVAVRPSEVLIDDKYKAIYLGSCHARGTQYAALSNYFCDIPVLVRMERYNY